MNEKSTKVVTESLTVGMLLAMVGGYLVAYTYIARGGVFANAQTGNLVNLSINLANGNIRKVIVYFIPIFSFIFGIFAANIIRDIFEKYIVLHWKQVVIGFQIVLLFIVGLIREGDLNIIVNAMISIVCAMQLESFRLLNGNAIATVICTGNMRSGTSQLYEYIRRKDKRALQNGIIYYAIILSFAVGVMVGTWFTNIYRVKAVFITCILLIVVFILMFMKDKSIIK